MTRDACSVTTCVCTYNANKAHNIAHSTYILYMHARTMLVHCPL